MKFHYSNGREKLGELEATKIAEHIINDPEGKHLIWAEGMPNWIDARVVPAISDLLPHRSIAPSPLLPLGLSPSDTNPPALVSQNRKAQSSPLVGRVIFLALCIVGSLLPVVRGCNGVVSPSSLDVMTLQVAAPKEALDNILSWVVPGAILMWLSVIFFGIAVLPRLSSKGWLFSMLGGTTLLMYVALAAAFVFQNENTARLFNLGIGWYMLALTGCAAIFSKQVFALMGMKTAPVQENARVLSAPAVRPRRRWLWWAAGGVVLIGVVCTVYFLTRANKYVQTVKTTVLKEFPGKTIGEAVDGFFKDVHWTSVLNEYGEPSVHAQGKIQVLKQEADAVLTFKIDTYDMKGVTVKGLKINGQEQGELLIAGLFMKMYEKAGGTGETQDAPVQQQQPLQEPVAGSEEEPQGDGFAVVSVTPQLSVNGEVLTVAGRFRVSSTLENNESQYGVGNLSDGSAKTCWSEGHPGNGSGEEIVFTPPRGLESLQGVRILNGYTKSTELFKANNRIKSMSIEADNYSISVDVIDTPQWQYILFPDNIRSSSYNLVVKDVYPGTKYNDLCVSEIQFIQEIQGEP